MRSINNTISREGILYLKSKNKKVTQKMSNLSLNIESKKFILFCLTSFKCEASSKAIQDSILEKSNDSHDQVFDESFKSSNSVERLCEFVGSILIIVRSG